MASSVWKAVAGIVEKNFMNDAKDDDTMSMTLVAALLAEAVLT